MIIHNIIILIINVNPNKIANTLEFLLFKFRVVAKTLKLVT